MKAVTCLLCQKMNLCQLFNTEFFKEVVLTACRHCPQKHQQSNSREIEEGQNQNSWCC